MTDNTTEIAEAQTLTPAAPRLPLWLLPSLLLASLVASGIGQQVIFNNRALFYKDEPGFAPHPPEYLREQMWNMFYNHAIGFGTFGALLVGLIGLLIGLTLNLKRGIGGLVFGSALGGILGIILGPVGYLISKNLMPSLMDGNVKSMLVYAPLWISFGIAASAFAALLLQHPRLLGNAVMFGIIAGALALIAFPILCSLLQPSSRFELIIPEELGGRFLGYFSGAVATSLAAFRIAQKSV